MIGTLLAATALAGCRRDRDDDDYAVERTTDEAAKPYEPSAARPGETREPLATRDLDESGGYTGSATGEEMADDKKDAAAKAEGTTGESAGVEPMDHDEHGIGTTGSAGDPSRTGKTTGTGMGSTGGTAGTAGTKIDEENLPSVTLTGKNKEYGSARFRPTDDDRLTANVDLRNVEKGAYTVYMVKAKDCDAIKTMETPFAGGPGTAGENKMGTPGPKTTMAVWMNLGTVDVDTARKGTLMTTIDVDQADLDEHALVIQKNQDTKVKASVKDIVACGIVKEPAANEGAG